MMKNNPFPYYSVPQFATIAELLELTKAKYGEKTSSVPKRKRARNPYPIIASTMT